MENKKKTVGCLCMSAALCLAMTAWSDETAAIQGKIDRAAAAGGGRVCIPAGDHLVGGLLLRSGVKLHLQKGARLVGSRNPDDYVLDFTGKDYPESVTRRRSNAIIRIIGAKDVAVTGEPGSEICGQNCYDPAGEEEYRGPHAITALNVTNLVLSGYTVRDAGNYGLFSVNCTNVFVRNVEVHGGHDGFDFILGSDVDVADCRVCSGDDCFAGFGMNRVTIRNCEVNSACSFFRIGGRDILVENCRGTAPSENPHRWFLTPEEKKLAVTPPGAGRRSTLSVFTFFTSKRVKDVSRDIVFRNCRFSGTDRLMHYNLSGNERWQKGKGLAGLTFENVTADGLEIPLVAYGTGESPLTLTMRDCAISFRSPVDELIRGAFVDRISLRGVSLKGVAGPLLRNWKGDEPKVQFEKVDGVLEKVEAAHVPFVCKQI